MRATQSQRVLVFLKVLAFLIGSLGSGSGACVFQGACVSCWVLGLGVGFDVLVDFS